MTRGRIVGKKGELKTKNDRQEEESLFSCKYIKDMFISTLNLSWITIYMTFSAIFFGSWFMFAVVWYFIFWIHGDFDEDQNDPCASNIKDFTSCFLFSGIIIQTLALFA